MAITQLSVFLMNQPGALVDAVREISGSGANIPAAEELITNIDSKNKVIKMTIPEGLLEL